MQLVMGYSPKISVTFTFHMPLLCTTTKYSHIYSSTPDAHINASWKTLMLLTKILLA